MENWGEQLNLVLEELAKAFNVTVDRLYPILIKQAYVYALANIITWLFVVGGLLITVRIASKYHRKEKEYSKEGRYDQASVAEGWALITTVGAIFLGLLLFGLVSMEFTDTITALVNPDYYVLKDIITKLK